MPSATITISNADLDLAADAWGWPAAAQNGETKAQFFKRHAADIIKADVRCKRLLAQQQQSIPDIELA